MAKTKRTKASTSSQAHDSESSEKNVEPAFAASDRKIIVRRDGDKVTVSVPVRFYRRNGRQMILADFSELEGNSMEAAVPNSALLTAIAEAYLWQEQLESEQYESLEDLASANKVDRSYAGRILQLALLAPDIVESILAGEAFADISLQRFRNGIPVLWEEQRRVLRSA